MKRQDLLPDADPARRAAALHSAYGVRVGMMQTHQLGIVYLITPRMGRRLGGLCVTPPPTGPASKCASDEYRV
jgi:hypothetical protein